MENKLLINGGTKLFGSIKVNGAKNSLLPLLAASVLCDGEIEIKNFVNLEDVKTMLEILKTLEVESKIDSDCCFLSTKNIKNAKITHELSQKLRASIFLLGALLGRFRSAVVAYPGGCKIGERPIDIHLKSFRSLGVRVIEKHGYIYCDARNMKSGNVVLDYPSVGATESLMMCASVLVGKTTIRNTAKEPEIVDLQNFLNKMGAKVTGAGTETIEIEGVKSLHGGIFKVIPDRIVAGTYLLATATCGGDVTVLGALAEHNESLISFLKQTACQIEIFSDKIRLKADKRLSSIPNIQTNPYPFFPTDLQSQMLVMQSVSDGACMLQENVFENRYGIVPELKKMGASILVKNQIAYIQGVEKLFGADVCATDLRCGAALVAAGMKAEGYTTIYNTKLIDRGYESIEEKYNLLGANIKRIEIWKKDLWLLFQ